MQLRVSPKRLTVWATYAVAGPISGPLLAGIVRNWRTGDRLLAGLYLLALAEAYVVLPLILDTLIRHG